MRWAAKALATFFGLGLVPVLPGTFASAAAVLLYKGFLHEWPWPFYVLFVALLAGVGGVAAASYASELGQDDPGRIVIDEVCGQLAALTLWGPDGPSLVLAFALFRFFDIIKPWPIRRLERLPKGWGIMADDLGAAAAAALVLRLLRAVI